MERLRGYGVNCTDHKIMTRVGLYKIWLGVLYHENGSYQGQCCIRLHGREGEEGRRGDT